MVCKCKGCKDRHEYCHVKCEYYIDWKREHDKISEQQRKHRFVHSLIREYDFVGTSPPPGKHIKFNKK